MLEALAHFGPHQQELRRRLIHSCLALAGTSSLAYLIKDQIVSWCMRPLTLAYPQLGKLVYTNLPEAFLSYIKVSLLVGLMVSFPYLLLQLWLFVVPGLLEEEKRTLRRILLWSTGLFAGGAVFAFWVVLPRTLHYFMSFATPQLQPMLKLGLYLTFTGRLILAFGIAFEIPFLMVMVIRAGLLDHDHFRKKRLYFYSAIVVLSFLLTAGDITATILLAVPLFGLYEAGILAGRLFARPAKAPA